MKSMIAAWIFTLPWNTITEISNKYNIDPNIVASIIMVESNGEPLSTRFEGNKVKTINERIYAERTGTSQMTETIHQQTSWGIMQVLGVTARDLGYKGLLPALCDLKVGMTYGAMYVQKQSKRYSTVPEVFASYNAGSVRKTKGGMFINQRYVDKAMKFYRTLTH